MAAPRATSHPKRYPSPYDSLCGKGVPHCLHLFASNQFFAPHFGQVLRNRDGTLAIVMTAMIPSMMTR